MPPTRILIYGTGENSLQAAAIFRHDATIEIVAFVDDAVTRHGSEHLGRPVIGSSELAASAQSFGAVGGFAAIGDNRARAAAARKLTAAGLTLVNAIHPLSMIDSPRHLGAGIMVEMGAAIHTDAVVGDGTFVMGGAIVSHHSTVGEWSLLGGGTVFGGNVRIGNFSTLGCGTVVQPHTTIGDHVVTGIGTAVTKSLDNGAVAVGVPARIVRIDPVQVDA
jgi:sugar O-acyltransferase (sialic acid O-acetyltransferase NeuD family)